MRAMRVLAAFSMTVAVALGAVACGGDGGTTDPPPPPSPPANRAPVAVGSLGTLTIEVGAEVTVNVASNFNDPDGDALTYTAATSDAGVATASVSGSQVVVTGVGAGTATITVTARDPDGLTATQTMGVTVEAVNHPPTVVGTLDNQTLSVGDTVMADVAEFFEDPEADELTFTANSSDTAVASATISGSDLTVAAVAEGSSTVTVTATDTADNSNGFEFTVTVEALNQAPETTETIPPQTLIVGEMVRLDASEYFADPDGDELSYEAVSSDTDIVTALAMGDNGTMIEIGGQAVGATVVTVSASDPEGLSVAQQVMVTVEAQAPNRAPVMADESIPFPAHDLALDSAVVLDVSGYFTDPDGDELTYTATTSDAAVAMASVEGSTVTTTAVSAMEDVVVTVTLMVTATDPEGLSLTQEAEVFVSEMDYEVLEAITITEEGVLSATIDGNTVTVGPTVCLTNFIISTLTGGTYQVHWTEWQTKRGSGWIRVPGTRKTEEICGYDFTDAEAGVYRVVGELTAPNDAGDPVRKRSKTENEYTHDPGS